MVKNDGFYWSSEQRGVFEMERKKEAERKMGNQHAKKSACCFKPPRNPVKLFPPSYR